MIGGEPTIYLLLGNFSPSSLSSGKGQHLTRTGLGTPGFSCDSEHIYFLPLSPPLPNRANEKPHSHPGPLGLVSGARTAQLPVARCQVPEMPISESESVWQWEVTPPPERGTMDSSVGEARGPANPHASALTSSCMPSDSSIRTQASMGRAISRPSSCRWVLRDTPYTLEMGVAVIKGERSVEMRHISGLVLPAPGSRARADRAPPGTCLPTYFSGTHSHLVYLLSLPTSTALPRPDSNLLEGLLAPVLFLPHSSRSPPMKTGSGPLPTPTSPMAPFCPSG